MEISVTEENYIKAIYSINKSNHNQGAGTTLLSTHLNNTAASVTDMLKRLAAKKLINYKKYKGVFLSPRGERLAVNIIRKHRLWEVFLLEKLHFSWDEVHDIAEQLEHIRSEELITRLDHFLGNPRFDPHGDPIPRENGKFDEQNSKPLNHYTEPGVYVFTGVSDHSQQFLRHLTSIGLSIGDRISVSDVNGFDRSLRIRINKEKWQYVSEKVSSCILVNKRK